MPPRRPNLAAKGQKSANRPFPRRLAGERNPALGGSWFSVSKGIDLYGYLDSTFGGNGINLTFSVTGGDSVTLGGDPSPTAPGPTGFLPTATQGPQQLQIESSNLPDFFSIYGSLSWSVVVNNPNKSTPYSATQDINPYTGNLGAGPLTDMMNMQSFTIQPGDGNTNTSPLSVSYGARAHG